MTENRITTLVCHLSLLEGSQAKRQGDKGKAHELSSPFPLDDFSPPFFNKKNSLDSS